MQSSLLRWRARAAAGAVAFAGAAAAEDATPAAGPLAPVAGRAARELAADLPAGHLSGRAFDDAVATNAFDGYLKALDFDRSFFLASDVGEFSRRAAELDDRLREGDVSFAFEVFARFRERVDDRVAFVDLLLDAGFDLEAKETYRWDRKDAGWPRDAAEWDELWRRKVKNEYVARVVATRLAEQDLAAAAKTNAAARADQPDERTVLASERSVEEAKLTPGEFVRKRYRQFQFVIEDSDEQWVLERFFGAFAQAYDPHTEYFSPSRSEDFDIQMKLSLFGIGALLMPEDGAAKIVELIAGGPAERDGRLKPGDRIVAVAQGDGEPVNVLHWPLYKTVRLIRGEKGTRVTLTVWPADTVPGSAERRVDLVREEVKLEARAAKSEVRTAPGAGGAARRYGVITLPEFYADFQSMRAGLEARRAAVDVRAMVRALATQDVAGVVLDLRNNGGGSLSDAILIAGLFIGSGPVVQVRDRTGVRVLGDPDPECHYGGPLVVLVNRMSASASEIVAAALQDYGRAVVVGDGRTHGKGSVQTPPELLDARDPSLGSVKLTTSTFHRIDGGSTQLKGVESDIRVPSVFDAMEIGEEYLAHPLPWSSVDRAFYSADADFTGRVAVLRERSRARMAGDEAFRVRQQLLARVRARLDAKELSLNLSERLASARSEKELSDRLAEMDDGEDGGGRKKAGEDARDEVMEESLRILADLAASAAAAPPAADPSLAGPAPGSSPQAPAAR